MAAKNFYDAVLIGLDLHALLAGALLAKRGSRVLLVGQGRPWPSYMLGDVRVPRAPFALTAASSPASARVFSEIALRPLVQRRTSALRSPLQVIMPGHRFELTRAHDRLSRELAREFPDARRFADALLPALQANDQRLDALFARDLMWPPQRYFERREFTRATRDEPLAPRASGVSPALAGEHPFARALAGATSFLGVELDDYGPRALRALAARLDAAELGEGGLSGLFELLLDSIRTHNGALRLSERVDALTIKHDKLESLHLAPSDEEVGCHFLLWGLPVAQLASLLPDRSRLDPLFEETGEPVVRHQRYTLNVQLRGALPEAMGRDVLLFAPSTRAHSSEPLWIEAQRATHEERALLTIEALLPAESSDERAQRLASQRERVLAALDELSPFLRDNVDWVDSPHDGRGVFDARAGRELLPSEPFARGPETMRSMYALPRPRVHGAAGLTVRTPIARVLLCNEQVVPGLGLEGTFLTAWSAARAVTRALRRGWMNRGRWLKVEL